MSEWWNISENKNNYEKKHENRDETKDGHTLGVQEEQKSVKKRLRKTMHGIAKEP